MSGLTASPGDLVRRVREHEVQLRAQAQRSRFIRYRPHAYQLEWWNSIATYLILLSANRVGKTENFAAMIASDALAQLPEALGGPNQYVCPENCRLGQQYICLAETFDHCDRVMAKALLSFLPEDLIEVERDAAQRVKRIYVVPTGAEIIFSTYEQNVRVHEGTEARIAWFDEPPKYEVWSAVTRGLVTSKGRAFVSATPDPQQVGGQRWLFDEIIYPSEEPESPLYGKVDYFCVGMHEACKQCHGGHIDHDAIEAYSASLRSDEERAARIHGLMPEIQAQTFSYLRKETHIVDDFVIPAHWPIYEVVDPHTAKGIYATWFTQDAQDLVYLVHAAVIERDSFAVQYRRLQRERQNLPHQPDLALMDIRGGRASINIETQEDWFRIFARYGFVYRPAGGSIPIERLHDWLRSQWQDAKGNTVPKLRVFRSVSQRHQGPWQALERYTWDDRPGVSARKTWGQWEKDWVDPMRYLAGDKPEPTFDRYRQKGALLAEDFVPPMMEPYTRGIFRQSRQHFSRRSNLPGSYKDLIPRGYSDK